MDAQNEPDGMFDRIIEEATVGLGVPAVGEEGEPFGFAGIGGGADKGFDLCLVPGLGRIIEQAADHLGTAFIERPVMIVIVPMDCRTAIVIEPMYELVEEYYARGEVGLERSVIVAEGLRDHARMGSRE